MCHDTVQFVDVSEECTASFRGKRGITFLDIVGTYKK